ncbi:type II toxin-antitoxin system death-on-curing family toxin [Rothia aerolata]|uniref:type II toxin-antitoxin system death-on-curing family toxin n=1 Tax=Rothia aerolata TaxID=1812262 RepID=UPI0035A24218
MARPVASYGGVAFLDSIFPKAAVLMQNLIHNHPFLDGNKRTAYDSAVILLRLNG